MNTIAPHRRLLGANVIPGFAELYRRQPELAMASACFLIAITPCLLAMLVDGRTINDINIWIKPAKFLLSLSIYYATLAWFFGYLPVEHQRSRAGRFVIWVPLVVGVLEMAWLIGAAASGVPAHFHQGSPLWEALYPAAGVGATLLLVAILVQGLMLARERTLAPARRDALVLGSMIAATTTLIVAGHLASNGGHWVGGAPTDQGGLLLFGWSRSGGDLRVPHFWALHAHQLVPLAGFAVARAGIALQRPLVWMIAALYTAFVLFTFVQALQGVPFIG
jgi:hypothetical protein